MPALTPLTDPALLAYIGSCVEKTSAEFGLPPLASLPAECQVVHGGVAPEFRMLPGGKSMIILEADKNMLQWRLQAGHEVFHLLFTPSDAAPGIFIWSHEMLANATSIRRLKESGLSDYATETEKWLEDKQDEMTAETMLTIPLKLPYFDVYGRAFVVGRHLEQKVGWEHLKRLAITQTHDGHTWRTGLKAWLSALPSNLRRAAISVVGEPRDDWA